VSRGGSGVLNVDNTNVLKQKCLILKFPDAVCYDCFKRVCQSSGIGFSGFEVALNSQVLSKNVGCFRFW
jgi:hypothetical protein